MTEKEIIESLKNLADEMERNYESCKETVDTFHSEGADGAAEYYRGKEVTWALCQDYVLEIIKKAQEN